MAKATLKINGEDFLIEDDLISIGRASDNKIALADDSNVSRYHAEIENRGGEFWLVELGSSNGTTLNGAPVTGEILLEDGDLIILGGTSEIEFHAGAAPTETEAEKSAAATNLPGAGAPNLSAAAPSLPTASAPAAEASRMSPMLIVTGVACGLAVIAIAAVVVFSTGLVSFGGAAKCEAKAAITSPENGEIISKETEITVSAEKTECVRRASFLLGETEIASAENAPYTVTIDPKNFPSFADGENHSLKLILEDNQGNKIPASEIILAFETAEIATPTPTPEEEETPAPTETPAPGGKKTSLIEIQEMSRRVLKQFSGSFNYKFDEQFLQEVQKRTAEYAAAEGYSARAENYRDLINFEFHKENSLDAPLGFLLAMSRSKFDLQKQGAGEGLWQLSEEFVAGNGYKTACQAESLSDKSQNCAAKTAGIYTKALLLKIFNGDVVYTVAAFGMNEGEASAWANSLPANRENFWRVITNPRQREQVAKFFAAAIVAENPQKFGLKKDKPLSGLYRNLIGN
jgi:pSer/pThr/pTyr-binding forkhead associated (FHA) protein